MLNIGCSFGSDLNAKTMTKQELIYTAKVTLTDKGKRATNGGIIKTMVIEMKTGYKFEWDWAFEKDCTPERIAYHTELVAGNAYFELHKDCMITPCADCMARIYSHINSPLFAYARFNPSGLGNYYTLYHKDHTSPTGVSSVGGCSEKVWEQVSKETGNQNKYYSQTENKQTAK